MGIALPRKLVFTCVSVVQLMYLKLHLIIIFFVLIMIDTSGEDLELTSGAYLESHLSRAPLSVKALILSASPLELPHI